jgi:hypothetical protein
MSIDIARAHRPFISSPLGLIMHKTLLLLGVCVGFLQHQKLHEGDTRVDFALYLPTFSLCAPRTVCYPIWLSAFFISALVYGVQSGRGSYQQHKLIACILFQKFRNEKRFGIKKKSHNVSSTRAKPNVKYIYSCS